MALVSPRTTWPSRRLASPRCGTRATPATCTSSTSPRPCVTALPPPAWFPSASTLLASAMPSPWALVACAKASSPGTSLPTTSRPSWQRSDARYYHCHEPWVVLMAREKVQIKKIDNATARQVTFSKRRRGLF
ncbi:MADS-box protein SVP [Glycine soja]|uniref:MADS-box protein SVP n=1 Tax=Glycine soja TaxID=3848 RepID=A0A0B2P8Z0_GLYSO|nr:MADS-box protein SVP [Glycine soja]